MKSKQNLYLEIGEYVFDQILSDFWLPGAKIPRFRELSEINGVSIGTVQHAFDHIKRYQIVAKKRGSGYFVECEAKQRILEFKKELFINNELPSIFKTMILLEINIDDLLQEWVNENG